MTTESAKFARPEWTTEALYALLDRIFPERVTAYNILDIRWLSGELGKSREAVYKWLRDGRLNSRNARAICDLANRPDNLEALGRVDRTPPTLRDFDPFVYA